MILVRLP